MWVESKSFDAKTNYPRLNIAFDNLCLVIIARALIQSPLCLSHNCYQYNRKNFCPNCDYPSH